MTVAAILLAIAVVWLLGRVAFEALVPTDSEVRAWPLTERLFAAVALGTVLLSWVALAAAQTGIFSSSTLLLSAAALFAGLAAWVRRSGRPVLASPARRFDATAFVVLGLVVAGAVLYAPPFEQVIGERDPSAYVVTGISIARTGSLEIRDEVIAELPDNERVEFASGQTEPVNRHFGPRFPGWYMVDRDTGRVLPQGFPLYPTIIAVGFAIGDIDLALRMTTLLAIAAVVATFVLGRQLFGPLVGAAAATLLLFSPSQVWYSRYANAEAIAQLLLIIGVYALIVFRKQHAAAFGLLAAMCFGLCWQAHVWTVWLLFPLFGVLVLDLASGRMSRLAALAFWSPLTLLGLHALLVFAVFEQQYLASVFVVLSQARRAWIPMLSAGLLIVAACWAWGRRRSRSEAADAAGKATTEATGSAAMIWARGLTTAALLGLAVYGYWIRPAISSAWRAESVERLVLAITAPVFWLAVAGAVVLVLDRRRDSGALVFLVFSLGMIVPVLANPSITRPLMWSLRRYQTFLPLVFLLATVPLWGASQWARDRRAASRRKIWIVEAVAMIVVAVILNLASIGVTYRGFRQPGDAVATVEAIAASVEDDAVLVFEPRSGSPLLGFAPALAYWKGHDVVWLHRKEPDVEAIRSLILRQARRGRAVYYFTQGFNYFFAEPRLVPHRQWQFRLQRLEEVRGRLPTRVGSAEVLFTSYRIELSGQNGPLEGRLDIGDWDDPYVGETFPPEIEPERRTRWTRGTSYFWLPGLDEGSTEIIVHADSFIEEDVYPRSLRAVLDGVDLGQLPIRKPWRDYVFEVPSGWRPAGTPKLELSTEPIQPHEFTGNGDMRRLGVKVDAIWWR